MTKVEHSNKEEAGKAQHSNAREPPPLPKHHDDCDVEACKQAHRDLINAIKQLLILFSTFELALDGVSSWPVVCLRPPQRAKFAALLDLVFRLAHAFVTAFARLLDLLLPHGVQAEESLAAFSQLKIVVQRVVYGAGLTTPPHCALVVFRFFRGSVTRGAPLETRFFRGSVPRVAPLETRQATIWGHDLIR